MDPDGPVDEQFEGKQMTRSLKAIGLALIASFVMSVVVVTAARGAEFHSQGEDTRLTAGQKGNTNTFTTGALLVECGELTLEGTVFNGFTFTSMVLGPVYADCEASGLETDIDMNGCEYLLTSHGKFEILGCDSGQHIEITVLPNFGGPGEPFCTITVFEQSHSEDIFFTSEGTGSGKSLIADTLVDEIVYEVDGGSDLCGDEHLLTWDGSYEGSITIEGETLGGSPNPLGIWLQ